ncbi:hypothetical protein Cadr_000004799, partial [Camelus dromedarius]
RGRAEGRRGRRSGPGCLGQRGGHRFGRRPRTEQWPEPPWLPLRTWTSLCGWPRCTWSSMQTRSGSMAWLQRVQPRAWAPRS